MKRVIVDFKKLTEDILNMLVEKFPDGYGDSDIVVFKNAAGETIEAVEVKTEDTIYLVKVSVRLEESMENHVDTSDDDDDDDDDDAIIDDDMIGDEDLEFDGDDDDDDDDDEPSVKDSDDEDDD
ncbi:DNA primase [Aureibaculum algae]|uniref:DNA primase n=1 Tax=Aureibaculum algae TaxID=2584122 RepID=UPI00158686BF|nr:DNA primase [Aureibaculum algae]